LRSQKCLGIHWNRIGICRVYGSRSRTFAPRNCVISFSRLGHRPCSFFFVTLRPIGIGDIALLYPGWPTISPCLPFTERLPFGFEAMNMRPSRKMKLMIVHDFFNPSNLSLHESPFGDQFPGPVPMFSLPFWWLASIVPFEHCSHNRPDSIICHLIQMVRF
jgi:hypothetical protein